MKIRQLVCIVSAALLLSSSALAMHHAQGKVQKDGQASQVTVKEALDLPTDPDDADDIRDDNDPNDIGQRALGKQGESNGDAGGAPASK